MINFVGDSAEKIEVDPENYEIITMLSGYKELVFKISLIQLSSIFALIIINTRSHDSSTMKLYCYSELITLMFSTASVLILWPGLFLIRSFIINDF